MKKTLAAVVAMAIAFGGFAGQVYYDTGSGVRDLAQGAAWVGGSLPTADDVAVLAGTGGEFTLGAAVEWKGLVYSNLTATVYLRPTNEATLTLGAGGVSGKGGANYKLTLRNYANEATSWYGIRSRIDADLGAHGTTMNIQDGGRIVGNETLTAATAVDSEDPQIGEIYQHLGTFHMTGGTVSNNVFTLRAGDYVQEGGSVWLRYALCGASFQSSPSSARRL